MANEMLSRLTIGIQNTATSPISYDNLENAGGSVDIGETKPLLDVSNYEDTVRRFIAGLGEGSEFTLECFRTHASPSIQNLLIARAQSGTDSVMRVTFTNYAVSPNTTETYQMTVTPTEWRVSAPGVGEAARLFLGFKVSGSVATV